MSGHGLALAPLLMLAACSSTAEMPDNAPSPVMQEEAPMPEQIPEPAQKPKPVKPKPAPAAPQPPAAQPKADAICPPVEGETHQQLMIRKLDCLIELYERDRK